MDHATTKMPAGDSSHAVDASNSNPVSTVTITASLEELQTDEQRRVLDIIAQLRKCGLDSVLQLPQIVVCGDQSAGKSSVLEALTEIPFPRSDNLCTRYATEIILRRAATDSITIKVIPDEDRPAPEQESIKSFKGVITDFDDLPAIMAGAANVMGIQSDPSSNSTHQAFSKDVLSIEIEGPTRPQLTLVDLPGLIQTDTRGVTKSDVELVAEITERYISQSRTICLAVIAATNDYANQGILRRVRRIDPNGERTLGVITKPDRLDAGSGSETAYLCLAKNEDVHFDLGWHVLKNRGFQERSYSLMERKAAELLYFQGSIFKDLPKRDVGIDSLRSRLSKLLFNHVQQELPKLHDDLQKALAEARNGLENLGSSRSTPKECREYLTQLSLSFYEVCKAAVDGHYEGDYFTKDVDNYFRVNSPATRRRLRAAIQYMNMEFSNDIQRTGHKYTIDMSKDNPQAGNWASGHLGMGESNAPPETTALPTNFTASEALEWVSQALVRCRGKELPGNFNPLLIGELFWEQSSKWHNMAMGHIDRVSDICTRFLKDLLAKTCPRDVQTKLWSSVLQVSVKERYDAAIRELDLIADDLKSYPINYNHYYTDTIAKNRKKRYEKSLTKSIEEATVHRHLDGCQSTHTSASIDVAAVLNNTLQFVDPDMDNHSCREALDFLFSIYKVELKTFVANITTQVIERHIVKGIEKAFSPILVSGLTDTEAEALAIEPVTARRQRDFLKDRIAKLEDGQRILKNVMMCTN